LRIRDQHSDLGASWRMEQTQRLPGAPSRHCSETYFTGFTVSHRITELRHMHKLICQKLVITSFEVKQSWEPLELTSLARRLQIDRAVAAFRHQNVICTMIHNGILRMSLNPILFCGIRPSVQSLINPRIKQASTDR
jgi:hypothetical protein